jgi:hypothetical protein
MNPHPVPQVLGSTDAERMDNAVRKMFSVLPAAILKERKCMSDEQEKKKAAKKPH